MTQQQIDRITEYRIRKHRIAQRYRVEINALDAEFDCIAQNCDHKYPDGTTSLDTVGGGCRICFHTA